MQYWMDTTETIPNGLGFAHFDALHLSWLGAGAVLCVVCCLIYRRLSPAGRKRMRHAMAAVILAGELCKNLLLVLGGRFLPDYLPLQLCSVNIYIIAFHALRSNRVLDNFLYCVCVPGALAALLFPTWVRLPFLNFMHIYGFTMHILLTAYPIMLLSGGDIRPDIRQVPKALGLLALLAAIALAANLALGTNFMFLMYAESGNPLLLFEDRFGSHLVGFPVILTAVIALMYLPTLLKRK